MNIEIIGVVTVAFGLWVLWQGPRAALWGLALSTLLGAAAAFKFPALGGASVPPALVLAAFFPLSIALRADLRSAAIESLAPPGPGFWLLIFTSYAVATAYFLPRLFQDLTYAFSLARNGADIGIVTLALKPRPSNVTQAFYLIADLACFMGVWALMARGHTQTIVNALIACAALLLAAAVIDVTTHVTDTGYLLSWLRNANYRMLDSGEIGGFKRIVGTFTEAGAFSYAALGFYAFCLSLWLDGIRIHVTGSLAFLLAVTLMLSTSSTAYGSFAIFSTLMTAVTLLQLFRGRATRRDCGYLIIVAMIPFVVLVIILFLPPIWSAVTGLFDATVTNKLATQSGVERLRWNHHALQNFWDTSGFGAGLGSVRASSFVVALLANVGVVGLILFLVTLVSAFTTGGSTSFEDCVARAGLRSCFALIGAACISAGAVDLGLGFAIFFALAASGRKFQQRVTTRFASDRVPCGLRVQGISL